MFEKDETPRVRSARPLPEILKIPFKMRVFYMSKGRRANLSFTAPPFVFARPSHGGAGAFVQWLFFAVHFDLGVVVHLVGGVPLAVEAHITPLHAADGERAAFEGLDVFFVSARAELG